MSELKIGIILGSTRPGRNGKPSPTGCWTRREPVSAPTTTSSTSPTTRCPTWTSRCRRCGQYAGEHTEAWAATIAPYDGYVFVTPEYNHSTSGVLEPQGVNTG